MSKSVQISQSNNVAIAAEINLAVAEGRKVTINGDTPVTSFEADAAHAYMNGTLSYRVPAKKKNAVREVFVKVGHMAEIDIQDGASAEPTPDTEPEIEVQDEAPDAEAEAIEVEVTEAPAKVAIPATLKDETGWLSLRRVNGAFAYAVTMDEKSASRFLAGSPSAERHIARAQAGGIKVAA